MPTPTQDITPPSHFIGLGGSMIGASPVGFGAAVRTWSRGQPSFQLTMSHSSQTSVDAPGEVSSLQFAPSLLVLAARPPHRLCLDTAVSRRGSHVRARQPARGDAGRPRRRTKNGFGWQGFGGAEFTFPSVPKFTLSADLGYYWRPESFPGFESRPRWRHRDGPLVREVASASHPPPRTTRIPGVRGGISLRSPATTGKYGRYAALRRILLRPAA